MSDEKKCFFFYKIGPFPNGTALETKWYTHVHPWQPTSWLYTSTMAGSVGVHLTNECANLDDTWKPLADHRMTLDDAQLSAEKELNAYIETNKPKKYLYCIREYQFESDMDWSPAGISFRDFVGHENSPDLRPITEGFTKQIGKWSITITRNKQYRIPFPLRNELVFKFTDEWKPLGNSELTVEEAKKLGDALLYENVNEKKRKKYYYQIQKYTGDAPQDSNWETCVEDKRWYKELYGTYVILSTESEDGYFKLGESLTVGEAKKLAEWALVYREINRMLKTTLKNLYDFNYTRSFVQPDEVFFIDKFHSLLKELYEVNNLLVSHYHSSRGYQ